MPDQLMPDQLVATIADFNRRLQILEATQRVGLNRVRYAWATNDPAGVQITTFNAWELGPVAGTWEDDQGNTGTGWPRVTVQTGRKALFITQGYAQVFANDPTYRSYVWYLGVTGSSMPSTEDPPMWRFQTHGPTTEGNNPLLIATGRNDLTPGETTYYVTTKFADNVPAAVNQPKLADPFIAVIPID